MLEPHCHRHSSPRKQIVAQELVLDTGSTNSAQHTLARLIVPQKATHTVFGAARRAHDDQHSAQFNGREAADHHLLCHSAHSNHHTLRALSQHKERTRATSEKSVRGKQPGQIHLHLQEELQCRSISGRIVDSKLAEQYKSKLDYSSAQ